jgi:pimeloyl-ACP methyl ester carboxylesterase
MRHDVDAQEIKPSWRIPPEMKWEAVNGYPMAYRDAGRGTPIVLVHGVTFDYRAWNAQFDVFSKVHRVIAVSLRHFYPERWDGIGDDFSVEQHAQDVAALIKKLNLGKVHLVGQSRGGAVAVEVAKSHPEVIRTLVLADASIEMPVPETAEAKEAAEFMKRVRGTLQTNLKAGDPIKAAELFANEFAPGTWQGFSEPVKEMLLTNIYTALGDKGRPVTTCDDVKKFDFPILLITADKSPKKYEFFYNEMRKCRNDLPPSIVIPNAGHPMHIDNPEAFNGATLEFVSRH